MYGPDIEYLLYSGGMILIYGAPLLLLLLAVPYILLRSRDAKQEIQDPQLGMKTALHLIGSIGLLIGISGFTVIAIDVLVGADSGPNRKFFSPAVRSGCAMILSGAIIAGGNWWFLFMRSNDRRWPAVRRTFVGIRLIIHGIIVSLSLTGLLIALFLEDSPEDMPQVFGGMLIVWFASWAVHFALMVRYTGQSPSPSHAGECEHCGYDLRGSITATSTSCPECGQHITAAMREVVLRQREDAIGRAAPALAAQPVAAPPPAPEQPAPPSSPASPPPAPPSGESRPPR